VAPPPGRATDKISNERNELDRVFLKKHFSLDSLPSKIDRVSKVSPDVFAKYVRAGKPVIVTDVADTWAMRNWTCDSIQKEYGEEKIMAWNYNEQGARSGKQFYKLKEDWRTPVMSMEGMRTSDKKISKTCVIPLVSHPAGLRRHG
jgi:hypothetical protein